MQNGLLKRNAIATLILAGLFGTGLVQAQSSKSASTDAKATGKTVTVNLAEQNGSKETGTAELTPEGADKTRVVLTMKGAPAKVAQPAHIHEGSCAKLDAKPKYPLSNVQDGKSTTVVAAGIDTLTGGNLAINVHKSAQEAKVYVACGDLKK